MDEPGGLVCPGFADRFDGHDGADQLVGGAGIDTADYSSSLAAVAVNLGAGTASGGNAQGDVFSGIENLTGSAYADTLIGNGGANQLEGGSGNDVMNGAAGHDVLVGGSGDDRFVFGNATGNDRILDFAAGAGTADRIDFSGNATLGSFADIMSHTVQAGADAVIDAGQSQHLTLLNVDRLSLHQDDFVF